MYVVSCLPWIIYILTMDHHFPLPMWSVCCPHGPSVLSEMGQSVIVKRDLDPGTHSWPQLASPAFRYRPTHSCAEGGGCSVHQGNQSSRRITLSCRWRSANPEGGAVWQGLSVCELGGGLVFNRYMALFCREAVSVACSPSGLSLIIVFCHLSWRNQFNSFIQFSKICIRTWAIKYAVNIDITTFGMIRITIASAYLVPTDVCVSITYVLIVFIVACQNQCQDQVCQEQMALPL